MVNIHSIWRVQNGSRPVWQVQCPCGVLTFKTLKKALAYTNAAEVLRKKGPRMLR